MGRLRYFLLPTLLISLASLFFSLSFSPLSSFDSEGDLPDIIDDVYLDFDTLRTDLADYRWPTDASRTMTSGFGAFRRTHFHAGIDISTGGRTGHRVFASRSGYIARILVSPTGYGKMLQIRHDDGFTTVYAHLQRFTDSLDEYVRTLQYTNERYSLDIRPEVGAFPVRQGDLIALSGETGSGPPHLHFEIRDERMNPANPLLCPDFSAMIADTRPPEFEQISFAPFDHTGGIDGSAVPLSLPVRQAGPGLYDVPRSVRLSGAIGVSSKASDRVNATWYRNGIYHYEMFLDSVLVFESRLSRFSAQQSEQIALHYDWPLVEAGEGRFQKLFVEPGNRLPLYSKLPERGGVLETSLHESGPHSLLIIARDAHGNEARLRTTLFFDELPTVGVHRREGALVIAAASPQDLESVTVSSRSFKQQRWDKVSYSVKELLPTDEGLQLPVSFDDRRLWRIQTTNSRGTPSHPVFICPPAGKTSNTSLSLRKDFFRDFILVTLSSHLPFTERPSLWVHTGASKFITEIHARDERTYTGMVPLPLMTSTSVRLDARGSVNATTVEAFDEFSVYPITPGEGGKIVTGDGEFTVEFPPHGVYQTIYCRVEKTTAGYAVFPQDVLLNLGATVRFRIPGVPESIGLFSFDGRDKSLVSTMVSDGAITGKVTKFLSEFFLERDTIPPALSDLSISYTKGSLRVRFRIRDNLSGVDPDGFRLTVNDRIIIAEYDPEKKLVLFDDPYDLRPGAHVLQVEVRDKMGNRSILTRPFRTR
ncbi:MAG: M23 family metallopeptidase [Ignavibacteriales bacterium]|nr:M23 family metallopeptidase [Ignavibacteriales bacterium]